MKKKEFIAYEGSELTIEWYYNSKGKSEALTHFENLPIERQKKLARLFYILGEMGEIRNTEKFRNENDKIYAFKANIDRLLCFFFKDAKVIITHGFEKKSDKLPPREKEKAMKCKKDYEIRCEEKSYYE